MKKTRRYQYAVALVLVVLLVACGTSPAPEPEAARTAEMPVAVESGTPLSLLLDLLEAEGLSLSTSRTFSTEVDGLTLTTIPVAAEASAVTLYQEQGDITAVQFSRFTENGEATADWPVCHVPPGNPSNAHTIYVGQPALAAHIGHGDTLGFCPSEMVENDSLGITTVVLADGVAPVISKATYDVQGDIVLLENGPSVGTASLAELLTVRGDEPEQREDTAMLDFTNFLRETLGEDAGPILAGIPESMGGTGPEIELTYNGWQDGSLRPQRDEECLPGECPGDDDLPSDGDPEDPGDPVDDGPSKGDGDGGGEDDSNDGPPSDGDPGDDGMSYDPAELARLEGAVQHWEQGVAAIQAQIDQITLELEAGISLRDSYLHQAEVISNQSSPRLADIELGIGRLNNQIERVDVHLGTDRTTIGVATVGVFASCGPGALAAVWPALGCLTAATGADLALDAIKAHSQEKAEYVEERDRLITERDDKIEEVSGLVRDAIRVRDEVIRPSEESLRAAEGLLELAEGELTDAREDLERFKARHGIG
jgi:hypothetical protein